MSSHCCTLQMKTIKITTNKKNIHILTLNSFLNAHRSNISFIIVSGTGFYVSDQIWSCLILVRVHSLELKTMTQCLSLKIGICAFRNRKVSRDVLAVMETCKSNAFIGVPFCSCWILQHSYHIFLSFFGYLPCCVSIQDILVFLYQEAPFTRGIFRRSAGAKACRDLRDRLDSGSPDISLVHESIFVIAVVLKVC